MNNKILISFLCQYGLQLIAIILKICSFWKKEKKNILLLHILGNIISAFQYCIIQAYSGIATKIIAILRDYLIIKKEKYKVLNNIRVAYSIIVFIYLIIGIISYRGIISMFPIISALIYTICIWNKTSANKIRKTICFTEALWIIYNIYNKQYLFVIVNILTLVSAFASCIKHRNEIK